MVDRREEIISNMCGGDPYLYRPNVKMVMDEYMKETCLELLEYMAKHGIRIDWYMEENNERKYVFVYNGESLTKEQLFENFL